MKVDFWDKRYGEEEYAYGTMPNAFFKAYLDGLTPGKLLLPAEGEGRNAVYAAKHGWDVYAFDQSSEAKAKALKLADSNQVSIQYEVRDIEIDTLEYANFDLIALIYVHIPPNIRTDFHKRLVTMVKPGGSIILEAFNKKQVENKSGGPKIDSMLYDEAMLSDDFQGLSEISFRNEKVSLDEGPFHKGVADVIRMLGEI
jgi:cyclopropane fatty-acyl-phospholipid synthase-like methyltransferase